MPVAIISVRLIGQVARPIVAPDPNKLASPSRFDAILLFAPAFRGWLWVSSTNERTVAGLQQIRLVELSWAGLSCELARVACWPQLDRARFVAGSSKPLPERAGRLTQFVGRRVANHDLLASSFAARRLPCEPVRFSLSAKATGRRVRRPILNAHLCERAKVSAACVLNLINCTRCCPIWRRATLFCSLRLPSGLAG